MERQTLNDRRRRLRVYATAGGDPGGIVADHGISDEFYEGARKIDFMMREVLSIFKQSA